MYCVNMARQTKLSALVCTILLSCLPHAHATFSRPQLDTLSNSFWQWRATEQPFTNDDIPRIERAPNFVVDWSPAAVSRYKNQIADFEKQWRALDIAGASVADQIDYRLLGSAIARVYWELDVVPGWRQNPGFYVDQSLGSVYAALLPPPPIQADRQQQILDRMERIPTTLDAARENLTDMRGPYMRITLASLTNIEARRQTAREDRRRPRGLPLLPAQRRAHVLDARADAHRRPSGVGALRCLREPRPGRQHRQTLPSHLPQHPGAGRQRRQGREI